MCGIFGVVGRLDKSLVEFCTDKLAHRGPDGRGFYISNEASLGHRRLAILDLSDAGKQPMTFGDGRYWITYNGEIYNYLELAKELRAHGHQFKTTTDTEVVLAAYIQWGDNCQTKFNGMWALAIWDSLKKELFLSRDRFGKKPLFYANQQSENNFIFASEMKAILPAMDSFRPNYKLIKDPARLMFYESTEECLFEGIKRFPAGCCGVYKNKKLEIKRWWNTLDNLPSIPQNYPEQVELFKELFMDACRIRMRSDVPLGTALSGGLDSSATISCMAHIARQNADCRLGLDWQHAFIASFPGTSLDEVVYAKKVAHHLNVESTVVNIDPFAAISKLNEYYYLFEELYITSPIPFMQTYRSVKSGGVSVTLDGHGADEVFGGYAFEFTEAIKDAGFNTQQVLAIVDTYLHAIGSGNLSLARKIAIGIPLVVKKYIKLFLKPEGGDLEGDELLNWMSLDKLNQRLYLSTHRTILPTLLRNYDRYSMANGVEIRMPFMDHRLVCFGFSLPWSAKIRGGYSKAIVRDAVSGYMPEGIAYRRDKIGFNSPISDWMRGPLREYMLDLIHSRRFWESNIINPIITSNAVKAVIENDSSTLAQGVEAWKLLNPFLWESSMLLE